MKILFIGDISGRPGREMVKHSLPEIKRKFAIDFVIANCENAAHGKGVTKSILTELQSYGIDFFTSGDHIWDQKEFYNDIFDSNLPIIRFYNYEGAKSLPGKTYEIIELGSQKKIVVAGFSGTHFMRFAPRNPFWAVDEFIDELNSKGINKDNSIIIIDFHAESTAEKLSFAYYVKDRVSAVLGTHTHVGTVDAKKMGEMLYITDVGMVGPMDASLWVSFEDSIHNFKFPNRKIQTMEENGRRIFNSVLLDFDEKGAKIERIDKIL